jgi:hypothetical protein
MHHALLVRSVVVPNFGRPGPGHGRARALPRFGMNKFWVVPCLSDGLVVRRRHGTSPVNQVVSARATGLCRSMCSIKKWFKISQNFIFFKNFTIYNQIHQKIIIFIVNNLHSGYLEIRLCNQIHTVITN